MTEAVSTGNSAMPKKKSSKQIIVDTMKYLDPENKGISFIRLQKYIIATHHVDWEREGRKFKTAFKNGIKNSLIKKTRAHGKGSGCYKFVGTKSKKEDTIKSPGKAAKKTKKATDIKKPVAKKTTKSLATSRKSITVSSGKLPAKPLTNIKKPASTQKKTKSDTDVKKTGSKPKKIKSDSDIKKTGSKQKKAKSEENGKTTAKQPKAKKSAKNDAAPAKKSSKKVAQSSDNQPAQPRAKSTPKKSKKVAS